MRRLLLTSYVVAVISVLAGSATAVTSVTTDPVGFTTMSQVTNADTLISIPFTRPPEFTGGVSSATGNVITVSGSPWTTNQFVYAPTASPAQTNHYYVLLGPAGSAYTKEGRTYAVTANSPNTLTVNTTDNLSDVPAGAQVLVIPNWTLGTLYPSTDVNVSFTATTAARSVKTEILVPDNSGSTTNPPYSAIYFFFNGAWRKLGDTDLTISHNDDPIAPFNYIAVRNSNGAPTLPLSPAGAVLTKKASIPLPTQITKTVDVPVGLVRPVDVSLAQSGLNTADGSFVATTSIRSIKDELFVYDPAAQNANPTFNPPASSIYFYANFPGNVGWRKVGDQDLTTPHDNDIIHAGSALVVRKAATASGGIVYWTNSPNY